MRKGILLASVPPGEEREREREKERKKEEKRERGIQKETWTRNYLNTT